MTVLVLGVGNGVVFQAASLRYRETMGTAISRQNSRASRNGSGDPHRDLSLTDSWKPPIYDGKDWNHDADLSYH